MSEPSEAAMREAAEVVAVLPPFSQRTLKNDAVAIAIVARALEAESKRLHAEKVRLQTLYNTARDQCAMLLNEVERLRDELKSVHAHLAHMRRRHQ